MNKQIKRLWVKALKSGKYKQTKESLRDRKGYCCLGVLCDIFKQRTRKGKWEKSWSGEYRFYVGGDYQTGVLPSNVTRWAALMDNNPALGKSWCAKANDHGVPFP